MGPVTRPASPHGLTLIWYGFSTLCLGLLTFSILPAALPSMWNAMTGSSLALGALVTLEEILLGATLVLALVFTVTGLFDLLAGAMTRKRTDGSNAAARAAVEYLDVWVRGVTDIEDPTLTDIALNGSNTSPRRTSRSDDGDQPDDPD
jgi:hypothetical protein